MGDLFGATPQLAYAARVAILKRAGVAVWDVLASCTRTTSLDTDIDRATMVVNDFATFYRAHPRITQVFFNGAMAEKFYFKHIPLSLGRPIHYQRLPSTSPAHAGMPYAQKLQHWCIISATAEMTNQEYQT